MHETALGRTLTRWSIGGCNPATAMWAARTPTLTAVEEESACFHRGEHAGQTTADCRSGRRIVGPGPRGPAGRAVVLFDPLCGSDEMT